MPDLVQLGIAVAFAVPCFTMAARLLQVWRDPMAVEGGRWVQLGVGVFLMEFILMQAGLMLGSAMAGATGSRLLPMLGMLAFSGLFAGAVALAFKSGMLLHSFLWMAGGRLAGLLVGVSREEAELLTAHAVVGMVTYFGMVLASVFVPFPKLGITSQVARATRLPGATGLWVDQPHRAIGAAMIYFLLLGVLQIGLMTWVDPGRIVAR